LKALDIGCAVGRTSYELTRSFDYVLGLDYSARFIQVASMLQEMDAVPYKLTIEGELQEYKQATLKNVDSLDVEYKFLS
jgi:2-polyprenyl-3-methyl-5-hydroxy-6-metoxy-1,4-benzoquinol methylase